MHKSAVCTFTTKRKEDPRLLGFFRQNGGTLIRAFSKGNNINDSHKKHTWKLYVQRFIDSFSQGPV